MAITFSTTESTAIWREYEPGVEVEINPITKPVMRKFRKQASTHVGLNVEKFDQLLFRHAINNWKGFIDPAGIPIPASDEMVDAVTGSLINFSAWVLNEAVSAAEKIEARLDNEIKN